MTEYLAPALQSCIHFSTKYQHIHIFKYFSIFQLAAQDVGAPPTSTGRGSEYRDEGTAVLRASGTDTH